MTEGWLEEIGRALLRVEPYLLVVAGPNGAGKTTFVELYVAQEGLDVVNADVIASTLSGDDPVSLSYRAAGQAEERRRALLRERRSFCAETVFSDPKGAKLNLLREAKASGYHVDLVFVGIDGPELAVARVMQRVEEGGHDVPDEKIRSRFPRTLDNLRQAISIVDMVYLFDNSRSDSPHTWVATFENGHLRAQADSIPAWAVALVS
jgi:predicted ABC-type ATPase